MIALVLGMLSTNAQTVSVSDVTLKAGETKVVSINLANSQTNIVSFQMDLVLPDGITINKAGCALGSRITDADQELTIGKQPDGSIRLTSTSFALNPIIGTSGEIVKLSLTAAKDAKGGTASIKNIVLATSSSQKLKPTASSFKVNVSYTLTYKVDGEVYKTSSVVCGAAITPEAAPSKEGHTFSGWSNLPATMPNHDVEVTGTYTVNSYFLFYVLDGAIYKTLSVKYGTTITPEVEPTKEGYTFSGWSEIPKSMPAKDVTITGSFSINSYMLTYKVEGEVYKTETVVYGTAIIPEAEPAKEGHTFSGWSDIPEKMPAKDVTITGSFTVNSYTLTYKVDGKEYKTAIVKYGTAITPEAEPTKEGYTFSGWSEIPKTMPAKDVEITGTFSINSYTLTYLLDGEVYKTSTVVYGTALTLEAEPTKEGYTFRGWSELPATMPAHDVTVRGQYTVNTHTLTYFVNGTVYRTYRLNYHQAITPEPAPVIEGYTFSGWSEIPELMPDNDVEVTGTLTLNLATGIKLDRESLLFNTVEAQKLSVTLTPADLINRTVAWSSTDPDVATVDKEGVVTPVNNGETYIIAATTDGTELKDSCKVTVDFKAATLSMDREEVTITALKGMKLTATVTPEKASQKVKWSSSDASIVKVDDTGTMTPLRNGEAVVTATTTDGTAQKAACKVTVDIPSLLEAKVTQTTLTVQSRDGVAEARNIRVTLNGKEYELGNEGAKMTGLAPNKTYHVKVNADIDGYSWTEEFDVMTADIAVNFEGKATPTTLDISAAYDAGDATVVSAGFEGKEDEVNTLSLTGLEPERQYEYTYYVTTEEGGTFTYKAQFTTEALQLKITQTKVVEIGEVVIVATSNIAEEENVNVGFEWRRYDWPDEIENRSGAAYIYGGTIEGSVKNLNAEKFWKIRPFFQSQAGNRHYGDWVTIDPSDASYFEPSVHTYNTVSVEENTAEVKGFVMRGSDEVEKQGFLYWKASSQPSGTRMKHAPAVPANAMRVEANGNVMIASLENLDFDTEYCYVAFVTTSGKETFYGEQQTFRTEEGDPDVIDGIESTDCPAPSRNGGEVYDLSGRRLPTLQKGMNIIRMSDGTTKKVMVK